MNRSFCIFFIVFFLLHQSYAQVENSRASWLSVFNDLVPGQSECAEVKQVLGIPECKRIVQTVEGKDYRITISYSNGVNKWNIRSGVVLTTHIFPKLPSSDPISLNLDLADFEKIPIVDLPGKHIYLNEEKGIEISLFDGLRESRIERITRFPPKKECAKPLNR